MKILHCIEKEGWEKMKGKKYPGKDLLEKNPFIHCSSIEFFWRVSPHFDKDKKERVLLVIETDLLDAPVKWEDLEGCGRTYPHIYGPMKSEAIVAVLPYLRAEDGSWIKNPELSGIENK